MSLFVSSEPRLSLDSLAVCCHLQCDKDPSYCLRIEYCLHPEAGIHFSLEVYVASITLCDKGIVKVKNSQCLCVGETKFLIGETMQN